jgi:hypothetical protein
MYRRVYFSIPRELEKKTQSHSLHLNMATFNLITIHRNSPPKKQNYWLFLTACIESRFYFLIPSIPLEYIVTYNLHLSMAAFNYVTIHKTTSKLTVYFLDLFCWLQFIRLPAVCVSFVPSKKRTFQ